MGKNTSLHLSAKDNKTGLKDVSVTVLQQGKSQLLFEKKFQRKGYAGSIGEESIQETVTLDLQKAKLKEGEATLIFKATDYSFRKGLSGNTTEIKKEFIVDTTPPKIHILHTERYIRPGG